MEIEKRVANVETEVALVRQEFNTATAGIKESIDNLARAVDKIGQTHVLKVEFEPVKSVVFGAVRAALIAVIGAILALVVTRQ